ncbi:MAG: hypothetical protein ACRDRV_00365 [Pseudonocardiaceae bacterium]
MSTAFLGFAVRVGIGFRMIMPVRRCETFGAPRLRNNNHNVTERVPPTTPDGRPRMDNTESSPRRVVDVKQFTELFELRGFDQSDQLRPDPVCAAVSAWVAALH